MFRAKDLKGKEVFGSYCYVQGVHRIILRDCFISYTNGIQSHVEVDPKTLAMDTFVKDKNKDNIYGSFPLYGVMTEGGDELKFSITNISGNCYGVVKLTCGRFNVRAERVYHLEEMVIPEIIKEQK